MTDERIRQLALAVIAVLFVGLTAVGAATRSLPWAIVGGWLGTALVIELTWRKK